MNTPNTLKVKLTNGTKKYIEAKYGKDKEQKIITCKN